MPLIIRDVDYVITMDPQRRVLRRYSIVIDDGRIADLGRFEEVRARWPGADVIDGRGKAAIPGLIDLHGHAIQGFLRGAFDELPLPSWLRLTGEAYELMDDEMKRLGARISLLEKLRFGVTTSLDMERDAELVMEEAAKIGVRLVEAVMLWDREELPHSGLREISSPEEELKLARRCIRVAERYELVNAILGPVGFPASSPELMRECAEVARELGVKVHAHASESFVNVELAKKMYGISEVTLLEKIGFLGPDVILAHAVYLDDYEIACLAKYGVSVAHCPSSNAKLGNGIARVVEMLWQGVKVGIGCDGAASNNGQDLFVEMRVAALLQKARLRNAAVMPAQKLLEIVTVDAAEVLGKGREIGSIEVGKRADIVLLDLRMPNMMPAENVVSHIVYSATGADVDTVIVDGRVLVREGRLQVGVDLGELYARAEEKYHELVEELS